MLPWYGLRPPRETYQRSKDLAVRALALDPDSAAAHTALAYVHHYFDWDWPAAEQEYRRGLQINPSYAQAHQWLAAMHAERGRTDAALQEMRSAERLDPHAPIIPAAIGWIQYLARDFDPAIAQLRRTVERDPDFVPARLWLGQALEASGRPADAVEQYLAVRRVVGEARTGLGELARGLALAGQTARARAELNTLLRLAETGYVEADLIARVYEALGDRAQTLAWLARARPRGARDQDDPAGRGSPIRSAARRSGVCGAACARRPPAVGVDPDIQSTRPAVEWRGQLRC